MPILPTFRKVMLMLILMLILILILMLIQKLDDPVVTAAGAPRPHPAGRLHALAWHLERDLGASDCRPVYHSICPLSSPPVLCLPLHISPFLSLFLSPYSRL